MFEKLREDIRDYLKLQLHDGPVSFRSHLESDEEGYTRYLISYKGIESDDIWAYLLIPKGKGPFPAVLVHHQHNGERNIGKSEVCGIVGDPFQAYGPTLAKEGIIVMAPDSISFEDRRKTRSGLEADEGDWLQHYNEMSYRLAQGDTLMRKVLSDASLAISILCNHPSVENNRIGVLGHSYGGNTVLFQAAMDARIQFACSSGAACTYKTKFRCQTGLEMALIIPGFTQRYDIEDLVKCIYPRKILLVSATEDKYSEDADDIEETIIETCREMEIIDWVEHYRYIGGHPLTQERFADIVSWIISLAKRKMA